MCYDGEGVRWYWVRLHISRSAYNRSVWVFLLFLDCKAFQTTARCASLFLRMFFDWVERKRLCSPPEPLHLVLDSSSLSLMAWSQWCALVFEFSLFLVFCERISCKKTENGFPCFMAVEFVCRFIIILRTVYSVSCHSNIKLLSCVLWHKKEENNNNKTATTQSIYK